MSESYSPNDSHCTALSAHCGDDGWGRVPRGVYRTWSGSTAASVSLQKSSYKKVEATAGYGTWTDPTNCECVKTLEDSRKHIADGAIPDEIFQVVIPRYLRFDNPIDGMVYVMGGRCSRTGYLRSCEMYDSWRNEWRDICPLDEPRVGAAAASVGNTVFVVGGYSTSVHAPMGSCTAYCPFKDCWIEKAPVKTSRFGHGMCAVGDKLVVAGGNHDGTLLADCEIYDVLTDTWSPGPPLARPIAGARMAARGSLLYLVGGCSDTQEAVPWIQVLDMSSEAPKWESYLDGFRLGRGRAACAVALCGPMLIAAGGFTARNELHSREHSSVDSLVSLSCTGVVSESKCDDIGLKVPPMPQKRGGCLGVSLKGSLFVVGGESIDESPERQCVSADGSRFESRLPVPVVFKKPIRFDMTEWRWDSDVPEMHVPRTAAAVCSGFGYPRGYRVGTSGN